MFKKKQRTATVVGLDLDPSHIAAAEVHVNGSLTVKKGAVVALRPGVLRDGEASDGTVTRSCSRTGGTTKGGCPSSNSW